MIHEPVYVFQRKRKPYTSAVVYGEDMLAVSFGDLYRDKRNWKHVATIDAARWIETLLNDPAGRAAQIERLYK